MPDEQLDMHFPKAGMDIAGPFWKQPARPIVGDVYAKTTRSGVNVRTFNSSNRSRGGPRVGLSRYVAAQVGGAANLIQHLDVLVTNQSGLTPVELSQSGRIVILVAVSQGLVYVAVPGDTTWTSTTNNSGGTPPLNSTGVVYSAANQQKLYFADGTHFRYYNPVTNSVEAWAASAGSLPVDGSGNAPRLICTWRGRTVLSGLMFDPQNWFMSKIGDPTNFDYSPASTTPSQAVAGNNSQLGNVGDVITGMCPYNDDLLIFFGDHTIWMMRGDPLAGGQIDLVSDAIGGAWGVPWCRDPYGTVYFVSNRCGIYSMIPGQAPVRISQPIENLLSSVNTGSNSVRLIWDDRAQGLHVFVTATASAGSATHYFYEWRAQAWWQDTFGNNNLNPLAMVTFDGNAAGDRVPLIGSWDGYVRAIDPSATTDDGTSISSSVVIGPVLSKNMDEMLLLELQAVLGETSGDVTWEVFVGRSAEAALAGSAVASGTFSAGRSLTKAIRRSGHAVYVKISSTSAWTLEQIRARVRVTGKVRQRGY